MNVLVHVRFIRRALPGSILDGERENTIRRVFQALRIWINDEAAELEAALEWLPDAMRPGGMVVTLAYHSGEDRRIKQAFRGRPETLPARRRLTTPA